MSFWCEGCHDNDAKVQEDDSGNLECAQCGEMVTKIPEHDAGDMER